MPSWNFRRTLHITQEGFKRKGDTCETLRRIECMKQVGSTRSIFISVSLRSYLLRAVLCLVEWRRGCGFCLFAPRLFKWLQRVRVTRWNATLYRVCCSSNTKCWVLNSFVMDKVISLDKERNNRFNNSFNKNSFVVTYSSREKSI